MPGKEVPVTFTFRKPGTQPPLLVAGTFSDPPWQLREMQHQLDDAGEYFFTANVPLQADSQYLYRFKTPDQDEWILDEGTSIVTDEHGIKANLLAVSNKEAGFSETLWNIPEVPLDCNNIKPVHYFARTTREIDQDNRRSDTNSTTSPRSITPFQQVPRTAVKVTDMADVLDNQADMASAMPTEGSWKWSEANPRAPLFAHEAFGAYETADDGFDHEPQELAVDSVTGKPSFGDYDMEDIDDPTIEKFPSERTSVLDTLRKIQSSHDVDTPHNEHPQHSLVDTTAKGNASDHSGGNALGEAPSPTSARRREGRLSHSSLGRVRSAVSLGSIAEEPRGVVESDSEHSTGPEGRDVKTPPTEEDEAVTNLTIKSAKT
ncbi:hypothetical protein HIM_01718 [Hirsutella minnesotensis 3608]|nr:hypothetical protein HIM_01718 [Hirsutella minnesotensis 3608]